MLAGGCAGFEWIEIHPGPTTLVLQSLPVSWIVCCIGNVENPLLLLPRRLDLLNGFREGVYPVLVNGKQVPGA